SPKRLSPFLGAPLGLLEEVEPMQEAQEEKAERAQPKGGGQEEEAGQGPGLGGQEKAVEEQKP
ncbi:hypothetical protein ABTK65_20360, partial [Acinetobacter baumannii]